MSDDSSIKSIKQWMSEHKLRSVGVVWASGVAASLAYNWSRPHMKTSVKIMHARSSCCLRTSGKDEGKGLLLPQGKDAQNFWVHSQALTLAALVGAAAMEVYERKSGQKPVATRYDAAFDFSGGKS